MSKPSDFIADFRGLFAGSADTRALEFVNRGHKDAPYEPFDINKPVKGEHFTETPLKNAITENNLGQVKYLIRAGADVNAGNPLLHAVSMGSNLFSGSGSRLKMAEILLDHGAKVDAASESTGLTPLMIAVKNGSTDMVRLLASHGANISALHNGRSIFELAADYETQDSMYKRQCGESRKDKWDAHAAEVIGEVRTILQDAQLRVVSSPAPEGHAPVVH